MQDNCQICGMAYKVIPAGISKKTGRPYNSFKACPNKCQSPVNNPKVAMSDIDPIKILSDEIIALRESTLTKQHFDERMDRLVEYLKAKFN